MKTVVGLGEVLWDIYPDSRTVGGAPANAALHAAQMGACGVIVSAVGFDRDGDELILQVQTMGGDVRYIQKNIMYGTGKVKINLDADGCPHFECSEDTAFDHLVWQSGLENLAATCDAVAVGTLAQRQKESRTTIQHFLNMATSALKVFDVNFRGWHEGIESIIRDTLKTIDVVKMNDEELNQIRRAFGQESLSQEAFLSWLLQEYQIQVAALTLGSEGCVLVDANECVRIAGEAVQAVDMTGCGDAFVSGMIIKLLSGASLKETGEFANRVGAFTATKKGAVPKYTVNDLASWS
ncbi:hypothetical protein JW835_02035 [bacterium]|nr:hypothetical protein [bacterium]